MPWFSRLQRFQDSRLDEEAADFRAMLDGDEIPPPEIDDPHIGALGRVLGELFRLPWRLICLPVDVIEWLQPAEADAELAVEDRLTGLERFSYQSRQLARAILLFPFRLVFLPWRALWLFHRRGVEVDLELPDDMTAGQRWGYGVRQTVFSILLLPFHVATAPIHFFRSLFLSSTRDRIFMLPAILMLALLGYVLVQVFTRAEVIRNRYVRGVHVALANENYPLAKTYFQRLVAEDQLSRPQQFSRALVLSRTGDIDQANVILNELAPEDQRGYGPAHQIKALQIANQLSGEGDDGTLLERLGNHLKRTDRQTIETWQAWALYHGRMGDHDAAVEALHRAAAIDPQYYLRAAAYLKRLGRKLELEVTLKQAASEFRERLDQDPLDLPIRVGLATALTQLGRPDDAEALLLAGLEKQPSPEMHRAVAVFYTLRYRLATESNASLSERLPWLLAAVKVDANYSPLYDELMELYLSAAGRDQAQGQIRQELNQLIAGDQPRPLAHLALSNMLWCDGRRPQAEFHLQQAWRLAPQMAVVMNNFAWVLAHRDAADLERALELVNEALRAEPDNLRFLDTRGTVLLNMNRHAEAIADLEQAIAGITDKNAVRRKLAQAYGALGMTELQQAYLEKIVAPPTAPQFR